MNKYLTTLLTLIISLFAINASAFTPPEPKGYVVDMAGKLSQDEIMHLNSKLNGINQTTKNEYAALIVPSMNGESIEQVAQATFDKWKVGKAGLDNGVLVVIAVAERKSRIQTGSGIEQDLPDILCNDILHQNLNPHLKQGDFFGGLSATFDAINSHIESRHNAKAAAATKPDSSVGDGAFVLVLLLIFGSVVGIALIVNYFQRKTEKERLAELERLEQYNRSRNYYAGTPRAPHFSTSDAVVAGAVAGGLGIGAGVAVAALEAERVAKERRERERRETSYTPPSYSSDDSSSSSSSSSYDYGSSSSSSSDYSGGGSDFGGGDSGGGGSSSDW